MSALFGWVVIDVAANATPVAGIRCVTKDAVGTPRRAVEACPAVLDRQRILTFGWVSPTSAFALT